MNHTGYILGYVLHIQGQLGNCTLIEMLKETLVDDNVNGKVKQNPRRLMICLERDVELLHKEAQSPRENLLYIEYQVELGRVCNL